MPCIAPQMRMTTDDRLLSDLHRLMHDVPLTMPAADNAGG